MLFNSIEFALFLFVSFFLYWFVFNKKVSHRNIFLLIISYVFYGWWDWRFLSLIILSSAIDYIAARKISESQSGKNRKRYLIVSLVSNFGFLGIFKYFNFFSDSFAGVLQQLGFQPDFVTLNVILPIGISFYTFQTVSYTIDVYRGNLTPTKDWIKFFTYVSFFPQLVAGPIERASNLLPQFSKLQRFTFESGSSGMRLILWGLFKKVVVADNAAVFVNEIFENYTVLNTSTLVLGLVLFAFQIYGDFSGYTDIARGVSRLFGIELMVNFRTPYFSRDIAEFWRRWHISLTTWFRDYVYIPLGGSKMGKGQAVFNTFVVFLLSGFWHGANWTFVIWGLINALLFVPLLLHGSNRTHLGNVAEGRHIPDLKECFQMLFTFLLICFTWIAFRAENVSHFYNYCSALLTNFNLPLNVRFFDKLTLMMIGVLVIFDWFSRENGFDGFIQSLKTPFFRRVVYAVLFLCIFFFGVFNRDSFIYFQF